jgi:hypothetical protein
MARLSFVVVVSFSFLAEVKVWEKVTVKRVESSWIFGFVKAVDADDVPVVFDVGVAE